MADRFDLEDAIMDVWHTAADLDLFLERHIEGHPMSKDDVDNVILGLSKIHNMRCEKLWDVFKQVFNLDSASSIKALDELSRINEELGLYDLAKVGEVGVWGKDLDAEKCVKNSAESAEKCEQNEEWLEDGYGTMWRKCESKDCGKFVVRPGKVDCWNGDCPEIKGQFLREGDNK
jgi:hypothetical protein